MSTLSSSSSYQEIVDSYEDNASWFEDGSATKAAAFVTACKFLIRRIPKRQSSGEHDNEFSVAEVQAESKKAEDYIKTAGRSGSAKSVRYLNADSYR